MTADPFDPLAESHEEELADDLTEAMLQALANLNFALIASALDDIDANHIRQQLTIILDLDASGVPRSITAALEPSRDRLASFMDAITAHAAAQGQHTLNTGNADLRKAREVGPALIAAYLTDTAHAFTIAIEAAIYGTGTPEARAHQLKRSLGLTIRQAEALKVMRTALQAYLATPRTLVPAYTDATTGKRIPASYVRRVKPSVILAPTRGHISAAQRQLLTKVINNPKLTEAQAEAILDKHAAKMRSYRNRAVAGEGIHTLTEQAKLTGWQIAQAFGALKPAQRRHWRTAGDERVRHAHNQVPGMNPGGVPIAEPFKTPFGPRMYPPLEHGCRCRATLGAII